MIPHQNWLIFWLKSKFLISSEKENWKVSYFPSIISALENKELIIKKADKGNSVVLLNRADCMFKMKSILKDEPSKFKKFEVDESKVLNYVINLANRITSLIKILNVKSEFSLETYNAFYPVYVKLEVLKQLAKIQKLVTKNISSFSTVLSATDTPTY